ncbi:MAG: ABC transporter ATP-binding protein [Chloroflexi bacterium]|nr:ABC transporter ATP-binding protein [Chloroflexota bacterium]
MSSITPTQSISPLPLVAESVSKQYPGGLWANRDISLTIGPSEILGILGPNGSGKTTFVRQITTETLPTSGQITVFGVNVVTEPTRAKYMLGVVPQDWILLWDCSVYHTLRIFGKLRGLNPKAAANRARELIDELEMHTFQNRVFATISGGERQRILLAMASLAQPKLLLLDEPTTGLDPVTRRQVWRWIRQKREQGSSVLITTHYMEEAEVLCDRVGIMYRGSIREMDTIAGLRGLHAGEFKLTYTPDGKESENIETIYGETDQELVDQARAMGIEEFAISKTSLEDVYLTIVGAKEGVTW